jgi:phosphate butyryltransferase
MQKKVEIVAGKYYLRQHRISNSREAMEYTSNQPALRSAQDIIDRAKAISKDQGTKRVVIAAAQDEDVLEAVHRAQREGIAEGILVGDRAKISSLCKTINVNPKEFQIEDVPDETQAAIRSAEIAAAGEACAIMKGFLPTSTLLKVLLSKKYKLKRTETVSHVAVLTVPGYHKLLGITDGGIVVQPDFEQKLAIISNAVMIYRAMGIGMPKIALLATIDMVREELPETLECATISRMAEEGQIPHVQIEGPLSFDTAVDRRVAEVMGFDSPVMGDADVVVASSIEEGNILAKSLINFAGAIFSGVIAGAKVPICLVSRADTAMNKLSSIALGIVCGAAWERMDLSFPIITKPYRQKAW